eukprot:Clim_evm226s157 gene=Clim_evmTU226s157
MSVTGHRLERQHLFWLSTLLVLIGALGTAFYFMGQGSDWSARPSDEEHWPQSLDAQDALFDFGIIIVLDALRADFLLDYLRTESKHDILSHTLPYTAYATTPTVTLPRIKAVVTGRESSFLDVLFNFGASEIHTSDNVVDAFYTRKQRIEFYGDDTWEKLFPGRFVISEGVHSFLVTDYTEVDNNVTRHLYDGSDEQPSVWKGEPLTWKLLILHYLGLDHIGHLIGPKSMVLAEKLREMAQIIDDIFAEMKRRHERGSRGLLTVLGDHGMTEAGSHGGASEDEISTGLFFISPSFSGSHHSNCKVATQVSHSLDFPKVTQLDFAPTILTAFGIAPYPAMSGVPLHSPLMCADSTRVYQTFLDDLGNAYIRKYMAGSEEDSEKFNECLRNSHGIHDSLEKFTICSKEAGIRQKPSRALSAFLHIMVSALGPLTSTTGIAGFLVLSLNKDQTSLVYVSAVCIVLVGIALPLLYSAGQSVLMTAVFPTELACAVIIIEVALIYLGTLALIRRSTFSVPSPMLTLLLAQLLTIFSSSFIEEEHLIWFLTFATMTFTSLCRSHKHVDTRANCFLLVLLRIAMTWNRHGDKYKEVVSDHELVIAALDPAMVHILLLGTVAAGCVALVRSTRASRGVTIIQCIGLFAAWGVRVHCLDVSSGCHDTLLAQGGTMIAYTIAAVSTMFAFTNIQAGPDVVLNACFTVGIITLRDANLVILGITGIILSQPIPGDDRDSGELAYYHIILAEVLFFAFGNSHSISSIDFTGIYMGQTSWHVVGMGSLLFITVHLGPLLAYARLAGHAKQRAKALTIVVIHSAASLVITQTVFVAMQDHLFIWSVFAPKFCYSFVRFLSAAMFVGAIAAT